MKLNKSGVEFIKQFEGLRLKSYKCLPSEKYYTIGYGHYGADVKPDMEISIKQAEKLLKKDLQRFVDNVNKYQKIYKFNHNEFNALVSFAYNIGSIDQLTNYGKRSKEELPHKMLLYCNSGGRRYEGLYKRRIKEVDLFNRKE